MKNQFVITGIGTDVGKTVASAIVAESLQADYWKPVQAGDLDNSDSIKVKALTSHVNVLPEAFRLSKPMSPHAAATIDGISIHKEDLMIPETSYNLIVEGAGGVMVPVNDEGLLFADLIEYWELPVIIVSRHYLGSINHSLLTVEVLKKRGVMIAGFIFIGDENKATEEIILNTTGLKMIARIPLTDNLNKDFITEQAQMLKI